MAERRVVGNQARVLTPGGVRVALAVHDVVGLVILGLLGGPQLVAAPSDEGIEFRGADVFVMGGDDEVLVLRRARVGGWRRRGRGSSSRGRCRRRRSRHGRCRRRRS